MMKQSQMEQELSALLLDSASEITDKAGFSQLTLWLSADVEDRSTTHVAIEQALIAILTSLDMQKRGLWTAVDYLVDEMGLASEELADAIESSIDKCAALDAADEFSAWQALHHAGGVFSPNKLEGRARQIRPVAPVKWLTLALVAHEGNPSQLSQTICGMVAENLLKPWDIESRYRSIQSALGDSPLVPFLRKISSASPDTAFTSHLAEWAKVRLGVELNATSQLPPIPSRNMMINNTIAANLEKIENRPLPNHNFKRILEPEAEAA